jgi:hypothetical protein
MSSTSAGFFILVVSFLLKVLPWINQKFFFMRKLYLVTALSVAFMIGFRNPQTGSKNFSVQQLAPGVWAAIQNDNGGHAISNAGIIDLGNKTLVFDAFMNPDAAGELKQTAGN